MRAPCPTPTLARRLIGVGLLALPMAGAATTPPPTAATPAAATAPAAAPFVDRALRVDGVLLGPQPAAADFAALEAAGITRVISLRTAAERGTLGFDDAAAAREAGLAYADLPIDGSGGFTPAVLDAFAKAMAEGGGDLLLHCGSGARAGQLYAAWLVRERGLSPQDAMAKVAPLGLWPLPMERMLGRPLEIGLAPVAADADPNAPTTD